MIAACRARTSPQFPIVFRFSQWKPNEYEAKLAASPEELAQWLAPLVAAGVDVFHCSTRRFWQPDFEDSELNLAGWTKKLTGVPTITVGSVGPDDEVIGSLREGKSAGQAGLGGIVALVASGEVDLVAVGRALLVDPAWAEKVRLGRFGELLPFSPEALKTLS